jgi:hypothetical protein
MTTKGKRNNFLETANFCKFVNLTIFAFFLSSQNSTVVKISNLIIKFRFYTFIDKISNARDRSRVGSDKRRKVIPSSPIICDDTSHILGGEFGMVWEVILYM